MESPSRGARYPVPSRVAHKLGNDIALIAIPHRPKVHQHHHHIDTTSLSGTTAPSSPTLADSPASAACPPLPASGYLAVPTESTRHLPCDSADVSRASTPQVGSKTLDGDDVPSVDSFRKHHRGIGSIDSMLSSTTCVNTQSECSRPASRVSRTNRYEVDAIPHHLLLEEVTKYASSYDQDSDVDDVVFLDSLTPTRGAHFVPTTSPAFSPTPISIHSDCEGEDVVHDETKVVNEISSWVLRSLWGKEVDECPAPLLVSDCTQRYLRELWTAAEEGVLRQAALGPDQGSSSPNGGFNGHNTPPNNANGKGKRKADGGNDDGDDYGEDAGRRDEEGNMPSGMPRIPGKASNSSNFSCPYRKRNPRRFNVREYYVCATHSFADMSQLKKHIRAHHPPVQRNAGPFSCPRCFQGFPTKNELDDHLRQPDVCHITFDQGGADPEDGITQKIIMSLEARTLKLKIDNWISLWKLLFPADRTVPDPTFVPVMEVFDFVAESRKFLSKLTDLLELQYRYVLEGSAPEADMERKIQQGLEKTTRSIYLWVETVIQDWEQRFVGTVAQVFSQPDVPTIHPPADDAWVGTSQLLPPSPALTPTVAPTGEASANAVARDDSPESTNQSSASGASAARRTNPPKRIRRSDVGAKTQIPIPIQKARTPQPQNRTPSSSLRRPSGVPILATQAMPTTQPPASLPPNPPILNPRPSYPQHWEYPQVSSPYGPPYTVMTSSPGLPSQQQATAPAYPATSMAQQVPFLPSEPPTPGEPRLDGMQHDPNAPTSDPRHSSTIRASARFLGSTPRSSLTSIWVRDSANANRDSAQTLVEAHPPGPCTNMYCPSCSKTMPDMMVPHTQAPSGMFEGTMVGMGHNGFGMHVVGEEHEHHGGYVGQGDWGAYGVGGGIGVDGTGGQPGGVFGGGLQEGF
ncbi:hypothetical protein OQA88_2879 [Cercophora sp. LCS_1]